ncbi:hypothetical protein GOBAR_AA30189 [Gossypium barbadense]|uniref:Uncharacterized protein n=1 Tax=Gossypium barbadense TaxID=3634 RepID=A0A2P5WHD9_GOSBA|nr:hypothetical protein GOBAR_AA30189 [Gossypium barbadense]
MGSSCTRVASIFVSDGKQARRTNSPSPLGELFDHGCDALASTFETMDFGSTAMCGGDNFWFWVILSIPFYGATWEHYFTNALILPIVNGPTEGLALKYGLHFMTAIVELPTYKAAVYLLTPIAILPTVACKRQHNGLAPTFYNACGRHYSSE